MMDEATWAACTDSFAMLNFLHEGGRASDRKLRLVCCALCRQVWHHLADERYRAAVEVAERHADGLASDEELREASGRVWRLIDHTEDYDWSPDKQGMLLAANGVRHATYHTEPDYPLAYLAGATALGAKNALVHEGVRERDVLAGQSALLRDVLGPLPFRPVALSPLVRHWNDGTAVRLAEAIYHERAFDRLPILADALEEAGCNDPEILGHCRAAGPHARGCWVVDLLLGRK
jgi:hypothetical protein